MLTKNTIIFIIIILVLCSIATIFYYSRNGELAERTLYLLIGITIAIGTGSIIYIIYRYKPEITTSIPITTGTTSSSSLNSDITGAIDNLYNVAKNQWQNEKNLLEKGKSQLCQGHSDVSNMISDHMNQHNKLLEEIIEFKNKYISHMEQYDKPHFHWV